MPRLISVLAMGALLNVLMPGGYLRAQQTEEPAQKSDGPAVFRTDTRLVVLHATVLDSDGKLITSLPRSAFTIYEDGVKQELKVFRREDIPVSLGLVIDNSASMRDKRQKVEAAGLRLVKESNPEDEVFIVNFNDDAYLDREFTSKIQDLEEGIARLDSRGGTAMRDALRMALTHVSDKGRREKRALLVITDGNDNNSLIPLEHLIRAAQQGEVLIYAIGLLNEEEPREAERARKALDAITKATGGQIYYPKELPEVDGIARQVAHDIRNQYTLAYNPTNEAQDGTFRAIRVEVNSPEVATVRTRSGYYASPARTTRPKGTGGE